MTAAYLRGLQKAVNAVEEVATTSNIRRLMSYQSNGLRYVTEEMKQLYKEFVRWAAQEGVPELPKLYEAIVDRYINQWEQTLNRAFSVAEDSITPYNRTILQRIRDALRIGEREEPEKQQVLGFVRGTRARTATWSLGLMQYVRLLFRTIPANAQRELTERFIRRYSKRELYKVSGGVIDTSAKVCIWCDGKVLDKGALDFVTSDPSLLVHLFHPNCRHSISPVPANYRGRVFNRRDAAAAAHRNFRR